MAERPAARVAHLVAILTVNAEGSGTRAAFAARLQHRDRGRDLDARDQQLGRLQGEVRRPVPARRTTRTLASGTWQPLWPTCRRQWVFVTVPSLTSGMLPLATFAEEEGLCLLLSGARTDAANHLEPLGLQQMDCIDCGQDREPEPCGSGAGESRPGDIVASASSNRSPPGLDRQSALCQVEQPLAWSCLFGPRPLGSPNRSDVNAGGQN